ncbi:FAD dependent oxidoreductase [Mycena olivaceomarginata]|nr:FAD dependent oxidoreductase [Mycena olivaceomarginata]
MSVSAAIPLEQLEASQNAFEAASLKPSSFPVPNPTRSFWIDSPDANPLAAEGSDGPFTGDADICIIGSGITGVSAAYHLALAAERGDLPRADNSGPLRVVILEARDFCSGATGSDFIPPGSFLIIMTSMMQDATRTTPRQKIVKLISDEGWTDAVDLVENGHTTLLFTSSELAGVEADFNAAKAAGMNLAEVNWLSKEEAHRKYGADYPAVEFGGFNLWPLKFVTHLYRLAKSKGHKHSLELNIHTRTPATSISRLSSSTSSSRRWAITTPRGVLTCSHIIHAANAYASHLLPSFAGPAGIIPTRGQVVALRATVPASELGSKCSWDANEGFEYWFPRPTSAEGEEKPLVILGGGREVEVPDYGYNETDDSVVHRGAGVALRKFLPAAFPGKFAEGGEPEMEWTGIMGFTKSRDPFVGPVIDISNPDAQSLFEGQYISAGYSGHGMPRAFSCAAIVASMVASDISGRGWEVPAWFPKAFLTSSSR